nr:MAG TPA: hypothetical protein [Caudoviricetes sp.]
MRSVRRGSRVFSGGKAVHQLTQCGGYSGHRHAALRVAQVVIELLLACFAQQAVRQFAHRKNIAVLHIAQGVQQFGVIQGIFAQFDGKAVFGLCSDHGVSSLLLALAEDVLVMGVALFVRHGGQRGVVAHRTVGIGDVTHGGDGGVRNDDALEHAVAHHHVHHKTAVLLFPAVGLDRDAGLQRAGDVVVAIHGLDHFRVQRFQQGILEGIRLFGLLGQHGIAAPGVGGLAGRAVGVDQTVLRDVAQGLERRVQRGLGVRGQGGAQRRTGNGTADFGLRGGHVVDICHVCFSPFGNQ